MNETVFSRRAFLKSAGAAALSTPFLASPFSQAVFAAPIRRPCCVVIGAGMSGLAAAYRLKQNGWDATVIEARPRIGGRVYTHRFENSTLHSELGGERISASHARMVGLCREFGLPLQQLFSKAETNFNIIGGNDGLPRALAQKIGLKNFHLSTLVFAVSQKNEKIRVQTSKETLVADACVCTVPARVLSAIRFDPALPSERVKAAWELQYARVVKSAILLDEQSDQAGVLTSCIVGDEADLFASQSAARRRQIIARDLSNGNQDAAKLSGDFISQAWQRDPWAQGAFAFYRPGQEFSLRSILQKPHGKIFFAGEHLADRHGSMEGAVVSGELAANAILSS